MARTFSTKQVFAFVAGGVVMALLAPAAVEAVAPTQVQIIDAYAASSKVRVNAIGGLWNTQVDPVTKAQAKVGADGRALVNSVSIMGNPAVPLDTINDLTLHAGDTRRPMFAGVGNRKTTLTSLIASAEGSTAGSVELLVVAYVKSNSTSGDCETLSGFGAAERFTVMVPVGQTVNLTWPTGLVWTQYADANDYYCINVESFGGPSGYTAHFSAYGYRN